MELVQFNQQKALIPKLEEINLNFQAPNYIIQKPIQKPTVEKTAVEKTATPIKYDTTKSIEQLFKDNNIDIIVTSGFRQNAKTKQGRVSNHSRKDQYGRSLAYDIKPADGNWDKLKQAIITNPEIRNYFKENNIGILDETTPDMMARTGATGKHYHIGPDSIAVANWSKWIQSGKSGTKLIARPSNLIKQKISKWEGSSMSTNTPHSQEIAYWNQISPNLNKLNQQQQDVLYDSLYNATPSYRRLIVPILKQYNPNSQWFNTMENALSQFPNKGGLKDRVQWRIDSWRTSKPFTNIEPIINHSKESIIENEQN